MHAVAADPYPRQIAGRLCPRTDYDLVMIEDLGGAVAVRSDDHVSRSVLRAARRAGYTATPGASCVPATELPRVAPRLLWVNPTAADFIRLGWTAHRQQHPGQRRTTQVLHGAKVSRSSEG